MTIRYIKKVIGILSALAIFAGIVHGLTYMYRSTSDFRNRILWHDYYKDQGKIENLYLGSSHVYCDIDSRMLTELTGEYCFDMASPELPMNGAFYLLREAERRNELKQVYLEMYYSCTVKMKDKDAIDRWYIRNVHNIDYMKLSENKMAYIWSIAGTDKYMDILFPFSRFREKLGDCDYIKSTMAAKNEISYLTYQDGRKDGNGCIEYLGQGFYGFSRRLTDQEKRFEEECLPESQMIGDKSRQYIDRIIRYCQQREIPITLFVSPINDLQLISTINYDQYVNEVREIADEYEVPFYDFNLVKEKYLPIHQDRYFRDMGHLNVAGAELFTPFFYQVVSGEESENTEYFCDSYADRLRESDPAVYGIYYRNSEKNSETEEQTRTMWVASNRNDGMEYRIILTPKEGEQYTIQDFKENKEFTIPLAEHGICTIVARTGDAPDDVQTLEINY